MAVTVSSDTPLQGDETMSWAAYHATKQSIPEEPECGVTLTFAASLLWPSQTSFYDSSLHGRHQDSRWYPEPLEHPTVDQPLYTLVKQIQWRWPETHGEDHFVILFGGLHIEMAALRTLGDLLENSGWTGALVHAGVYTSGTADSFLKAAHVTRTRQAHQISQ